MRDRHVKASLLELDHDLACREPFANNEDEWRSRGLESRLQPVRLQSARIRGFRPAEAGTPNLFPQRAQLLRIAVTSDVELRNLRFRGARNRWDERFGKIAGCVDNDARQKIAARGLHAKTSTGDL